MLGCIRVLAIVVTDVLLIFPRSTEDSWHVKLASARTSPDRCHAQEQIKVCTVEGPVYEGKSKIIRTFAITHL